MELRRLVVGLTSAFEALVVFASGFDGVLGPWELGEACFADGGMRLDAEAVGPVGNSLKCFVDFVNELTVRGGEVEVQALLEAFGTELGGVARGLGFTRV